VWDRSQQCECVYDSENLIPTWDRDPVCHHCVPLTAGSHPASCPLDTGECFLKDVEGSERSC